LKVQSQLIAADGSKKIFQKEKTLVVTFYNENEQIGEIEEDGEVMVNYFRVKAAEALEEGIKFAE